MIVLKQNISCQKHNQIDSCLLAKKLYQYYKLSYEKINQGVQNGRY